MQHFKTLAASVLCVAVTTWAAAQAQPAPVKIDGAWARASVQGQKASGAFMKLTAKDGTRLISASSPVAGVTEVHEMKMDGDVMRMRPIAGLDLPAGKTVELKPGGYHVMLLDLKAPLTRGSSIPLTLKFKDAKGQETSVNLSVPVGLQAPSAHEHRH